MECTYLKGENVASKASKDFSLLVGKRVEYLLKSDIDRSGRGYFFPRTGEILGAYKKNIEIDYPCNYVYIPDIVEMIVLE